MVDNAGLSLSDRVLGALKAHRTFIRQTVETVPDDRDGQVVGSDWRLGNGLSIVPQGLLVLLIHHPADPQAFIRVVRFTPSVR